MTNSNQAVQSTNNEPTAPINESTVNTTLLNSEQQYRVGFYLMLANLLRNTPTKEVLDEIQQLASVDPDENDLTLSMSTLGLAASTSDPAVIKQEFYNLFIGLGRGELVPYGSWYQTGFLMERPLGDLRTSLAKLGYQQDESAHEPEDHVAALCEVMVLMINDGLPVATQQAFYSEHMEQWIGRFYSDLSQAKTAVFYRAVGRFGMAYMAVEQRYLSMTA